MGRRKITYKEVLKANCKRIAEFYNSEHYAELKEKDLDLLRKVITEDLYVDPDNKINILCDRTKNILSADGIVSVKKLYDLFCGNEGEKWLKEYACIRSEEYVCLFWPKHKGNINVCKRNVFDDRVDYTLYDIKRFYEIIKKHGGDEKRIKEEVEQQCGLGSAFTKEKTYGWLRAFNGFTDFIESRGLKKFVNLKFEVIDLETNEPIIGYKEGKNAYEWGMDYYENLKTKVFTCSI